KGGGEIERSASCLIVLLSWHAVPLMATKCGWSRKARSGRRRLSAGPDLLASGEVDVGRGAVFQRRKAHIVERDRVCWIHGDHDVGAGLRHGDGSARKILGRAVDERGGRRAGREHRRG